MNNSGLSHVAISIKLHSPHLRDSAEMVETSGHGSVVNQYLEGWKLMRGCYVKSTEIGNISTFAKYPV